ncbi:hypothetical protein LTR53_017860, partial [Teratosphaeriaceae sp. CCFEE 6253]
MAEILAAIRQPSSLDEQVAALRHVKHDIVGHDHRQERYVAEGAIPVLADVLSSRLRPAGKRHSDTNGVESSRWDWTQEDEASLQATLVIGTLANGGPAFIPPLLAADVPQTLLDSLVQTSAPKLTTATLQALRNMAVAWSASQEHSAEEGTHGSLDLLTKHSIESLARILHGPYSDGHRNQQHQLRLVADILTLSATSEAKKTLLCQSTILDQLAAFLVTYSVANKHFEHQITRFRSLPPPALATLTSMMSAICAIISGSTYRTHRFFLSSNIRDLFPSDWGTGSDQRHVFGARQGFAPMGEPLLPLLHIPAYGTTTYHYGSRAFPAMAVLQNQERRGHAVFESISQGGDLDHANAVCSWLLLLARSMQSYSRLMALKLLALVNNAIDAEAFDIGHRSEYTQKNRVRKKQICLLAVPLAEKLVQVANESKIAGLLTGAKLDDLLVKEEACDVLALLIRDFDELQVAAVDAGAIKHVCPLLKRSFNPVPPNKAMWSAKANSST